MPAAPRSGRLVAYRKRPLTSFNDFGLVEPITRALRDEKYETPTPIQAQTIPLALASRDVIGIAQTGTGKTAAFALPILHHIVRKRLRPERKACRVLVLSPTRELSGQISDSFMAYGRYIRPLAVTLAIGGVPINRQIRSMSHGVEVLVATPGRLLDLVDQRAVRLDKVEVLVLDEADRMLDMGFIHDIRKVVAMLPKDRQTLFFSATMPQEITRLADAMLRDPAKVAVTPQATTAERVNQRVILVEKSAKNTLLAEVLKSEKSDRVLVFTRTKHGADKVVRVLEKAGLRAEAIHGNKSQNNRERTLKAFRDGSLRTLIATDIAARGIDVDGVSHVINFDLPNIPESYVHRIGRTARAGAEGVAISFCDHEEAAYLRDIEKLIRMSIPAENRRTGRPQEAHVQRAAPHQHKKHGNGGGKGRNHRNGQRHRSHAEPRNGGGHRPQHAQGNGAPQTAPKGEPTAMQNVTFMREPRRQAGHRAPR
ncbi:MAG TPA: DEAD/DEAH box helicase [Pseudolabrys sp.]|nr:DEAD/DEAH box helicase [Pseudolabrys sp.]